MKRLSGIVLVMGALLTMAFVSCRSLQQDRIIFTDSDEKSFVAYEEKLAVLDAEFYLGSEDEAAFDESLGDFIAEVENQISAMGMNNAVLSRLYALEGKAWLMKGNVKKAKACYESSSKNFKGDSQNIILGYRLGLVEDLEDQNLISGCSDKYLLILERAVQSYAAMEFSSSAALFDEAFLDLDEFYSEAYMGMRNQAWALKDLDLLSEDAEVQSMMIKNQLTVSQMLLLTQETSDFLIEYSEGQILAEDDLYILLLQKGLLNSVSSLIQEENVVLEKDEIVTRVLCARFLWNLYAKKHNINAQRYSVMFRSMNIESPVADIDVYDIDFDAVLGCVENEIINLTDGVNFNGNEVPSAIEVGRWLQKVE